MLEDTKQILGLRLGQHGVDLLGRRPLIARATQRLKPSQVVHRHPIRQQTVVTDDRPGCVA